MPGRSGRSFAVLPQWTEVRTRNERSVRSPRFVVPVEVRQGDRFREPVDFVWDTGATFCTVDRPFASNYGLRLHEDHDRVRGGVNVVGGNRQAWLTMAVVRFPSLAASGKPDLGFSMYFLVVDGPVPTPLLGVRGVLANFNVVTGQGGAVFELRRDHEGRPV